MKYVSSRGQEKGLSFEQVLFSGYSSDGGIYFPERIPTVDESTLAKWEELSYKDLVKEIMKLFIDQEELPHSDLESLVDSSFGRFQVPAAATAKEAAVDDVIAFHDLDKHLTVAELFYGPTFAFKDLALGVVGSLYSYFLNKSKKPMTVVVGTSGDTGSAAIEAVRGKDWLDIVVLLPQGRCTKVQELQMTTVLDDNVHNFCVDGTSDDLDIPIKQLYADWQFIQDHRVCNINSINWARIMIQIAHYIYIYFYLKKRSTDKTPLEIVVPTGACGNIAAGCVARQMGVSGLRLVAAVNENDIVGRFIASGDFSVSEEVVSTWASAMDIQIPYNVERILLAATDVDVEGIGKLMRDFDANNRVQIPSHVMQKVNQIIVGTMSVKRDDILSTMKRSHDDYNYLACPHTAVGLKYSFDAAAAEEKSENGGVVERAVIATAAPDKFPEAIEASGIKDYFTPPNISKLFTMPTKYEEMKAGQDWLAILVAKIKAISKSRL